MASATLVLGGVVGMDFIVLDVSVLNERLQLGGGAKEVCRFVFVVSVEAAFDVSILGDFFGDENDLRGVDDRASIPGFRLVDRLLRRPARVDSAEIFCSLSTVRLFSISSLLLLRAFSSSVNFFSPGSPNDFVRNGITASFCASKCTTCGSTFFSLAIDGIGWRCCVVR